MTAQNTSSHTACIGADMDCLHSCITYTNNKLILPEVSFYCSCMLSCFLWVLYHFSGLQKKNNTVSYI